jgi:hypothetical protein
MQQTRFLRRLTVGSLTWLGFLCIGLTAAYAAPTIKPLPKAAHNALHSFVGGTPIRRNNHYIRTNERRHDLFKPFIKNIRGGYIGIASDQSYTLMAYAQSEYAILIDYDSEIQQIHRIHRAFILHSDNAVAFLQKWHKSNAKSSIALLNKVYATSQFKKSIVRAYRIYNRKLHKYLSKRHKYNSKTRPTWLNTPRYYRYMKQMHKAGRIRIMYGNLIGGKTILGIGKAARKIGIPIRIFYTSNSEEWIRYRAAFRRNINGLFVDAKSVMLRTLWIKLFQPKASDLWQYNVQRLQQFQQFLNKGDSWVGTLDTLTQLSHLWGVTLIGFPTDYQP